MADSDRQGSKPYKTYKAGRGKRRALDDELAGARPARPPKRGQPDPQGQSSRGDGQSGDKGYQVYDASPAAGRGDERPAGGKRPAGAPGPSKRRRRFRWWHVPIALFLVLVVAGVVVTVLAWPGYQKFSRSVEAANRRLDKISGANAQTDRNARAQLTPDNGWIWRKGTTLLLFGVDSKAGEPARSDTIMLMRFNPGTRTINQLSIPRDTYVPVPGQGLTKINEAMFWGGPSMAIKTVKQFLGIDVNHVMVVNFTGFPRLVDAAGGVDLYVPKTISTIAGKYPGRPVTFDKGMHHFNGKYAMLYVRIRHADDDFHRAARQQAFVQALEKKIAQPSNLTKLPEIGKRFMSGVATDLTTNQIIELAYLKWRATGGKKAVMVGTPAWINGGAYVLPPSQAARQKMVQQFLTH
ncbi:MAG TPA: LCP family protein [Thermoleophilia bacterium]|nr:LCP family protein [Thermoleophilia bacterium]